jgi:hypothetical protein
MARGEKQLELPRLTIKRFLDLISENNETELRKYPAMVLGSFVNDLLARTRTTIDRPKMMREDISGQDVQNEIVHCWNQLLLARTAFQKADTDEARFAAIGELGVNFAKLLWHISSPRKDFQAYITRTITLNVHAGAFSGKEGQYALSRAIGIIRGLKEVDPKWGEELEKEFLR